MPLRKNQDLKKRILGEDEEQCFGEANLPVDVVIKLRSRFPQV